MAWFEAHEELPRHPKTLKLARALKKNKYETVGLLWCLFSWGLTAAQKDGSLPGMTADDIAMALDWPGKKAEELVEALLFSGYLEQDGDTYYIHDWYDYSGKLMDKREADKQRKSAERASRRNAKNEGQPAPCPQDIQRTSNGNPLATVPYLTVPNRTMEEDNNSVRSRMSSDTKDSAPKSEPVRRTDADDADTLLSDFEAIRQAWNGLGLGTITPIDPMSARGAAVQMRLDRFGKDGVLAAIAHVRESGFLRGENDRGWRASFDWLMEETHCQRAIEGGYADYRSMPRPEGKTDQELRDEKYGSPQQRGLDEMQKMLERLEAGKC